MKSVAEAYNEYSEDHFHLPAEHMQPDIVDPMIQEIITNGSEEKWVEYGQSLRILFEEIWHRE